MLNLSQVQAFLAVIDESGFQGAAQALGLAQPTVSQQLRKLEETLGVQLVVRTRSGSQPTSDGRAFLPYARGLIRTAERAMAAVGGRALSIGASSNIGTYLLPRRLHRFAADRGAGFDHVLGTNPETAGRLDGGEVDIAVMEWWDNRPGFTAMPWRREPMVVIVSPRHPWGRRRSVSRALLLDQPMIGGEPGTGTGTLLQKIFGRNAGRLNITMQLGSTAAVKEAVKAGLGISLVLAGTVEEEVKAKTLVALRLDDADLSKDLYVVLPEDTPETSAAARFAQTLMAA
ncbi:MAG: LysR family transcriptional regulator [Gammaproteobacteria bacterium]|jgi:DNA-binding transcriptional LysR family regulator